MKLHRKQNWKRSEITKRVARACGRKITDSMENAAKDFKQKISVYETIQREYIERQLCRLVSLNVTEHQVNIHT